MILALLNQKGGAGKTVLSTNLAVAFQRSGAEVLLVDSDFQGSAVLWRALSPGSYPDVVHATTPGAIGEAIRTSRMAAGPMVTTQIAGKMQNTSGKTIFTGSFCASSSAD